MASLNKVQIIGNLGRDPEIRYMPSGDAIANIAVATSYKPKDKDPVVEWHRISFFGRLAEVVGQYLTKGSSVYIEGRLQTRKYTDKDGVEKYATEIIAENMQMLGSKQEGQSDKQEAPARPASNREQNRERQYNQSRPTPDFSDDVPFAPFMARKALAV